MRWLLGDRGPWPRAVGLAPPRPMSPLCPRLPPATLSCSLCLAHSRAELRRTRDLGIASGMGELLSRLACLGDLRGRKENWRGTLDRPGCQQSVIPRVEGCRPLSEHPRQLLGFGPVGGLVREGRRGFHFLLGPSKRPRRSPGFRGQVSPRQRAAAAPGALFRQSSKEGDIIGLGLKFGTGLCFLPGRVTSYSRRPLLLIAKGR